MQQELPNIAVKVESEKDIVDCLFVLACHTNARWSGNEHPLDFIPPSDINYLFIIDNKIYSGYYIIEEGSIRKRSIKSKPFKFKTKLKITYKTPRGSISV